MPTDSQSIYWGTLILGLVLVGLTSWIKIHEPIDVSNNTNASKRFLPIYLARRDQFRRVRTYYILSMVGIFFLLCVIGPTGASLLFGKQIDKTVFPLGLAVVMLGLSQGQGKFNLIEQWIRRFWHQRARIPTGAQELALELRSADFKRVFPMPEDRLIDLDQNVFSREVSTMASRASYLIESLKDASVRDDLVDIQFFAEYTEEWETISNAYDSLCDAIARIKETPHQTLSGNERHDLLRRLRPFLDKLYMFVACGVLFKSRSDLDLKTNLKNFGFTLRYTGGGFPVIELAIRTFFPVVLTLLAIQLYAQYMGHFGYFLDNSLLLGILLLLGVTGLHIAVTTLAIAFRAGRIARRAWSATWTAKIAVIASAAGICALPQLGLTAISIMGTNMTLGMASLIIVLASALFTVVSSTILILALRPRAGPWYGPRVLGFATGGGLLASLFGVLFFLVLTEHSSSSGLVANARAVEAMCDQFTDRNKAGLSAIDAATGLSTAIRGTVDEAQALVSDSLFGIGLADPADGREILTNFDTLDTQLSKAPEAWDKTPNVDKSKYPNFSNEINEFRDALLDVKTSIGALNGEYTKRIDEIIAANLGKLSIWIPMCFIFVAMSYVLLHVNYWSLIRHPTDDAVRERFDEARSILSRAPGEQRTRWATVMAEPVPPMAVSAFELLHYPGLMPEVLAHLRADKAAERDDPGADPWL